MSDGCINDGIVTVTVRSYNLSHGEHGGKGDIGCEERHGPPRLRSRFKGEVSNSEAAEGQHETPASRAREKEDCKIAICTVLEWIRLIK